MMDSGMSPTPEVIAAPPPEKRVWGPWATAGFGAVVLFVFFAVMAVIMVITAVVLALTQPGPAGSVEEMMDLITENLGLMISVAGLGSAIVGTANIFAIIKVRKGAGIAEYP